MVARRISESTLHIEHEPEQQQHRDSGWGEAAVQLAQADHNGEAVAPTEQSDAPWNTPPGEEDSSQPHKEGETVVAGENDEDDMKVAKRKMQYHWDNVDFSYDVIITRELRLPPQFTYNIKIALGFFQIASLLSSTLDTRLPSTYQTFISYFAFVTLDLVPWSTLSCVTHIDYYLQFLLSVLAGPIVLFLLFLFGWMPLKVPYTCVVLLMLTTCVFLLRLLTCVIGATTTAAESTAFGCAIVSSA